MNERMTESARPQRHPSRAPPAGRALAARLRGAARGVAGVRPGRCAAGADRAEPERRFRAGLRLRLAHHPDAEGVAADAVAGDRPAHRAGDRQLRGHRRRRAAGRRSPEADRLRLGSRHPAVHGAAPAADHVGGDLDADAGRQRHFRFLCRGRRCAASRRGTASCRRRRCARADHQGAERAGRRCGSRSFAPISCGCAA